MAVINLLQRQIEYQAGLVCRNRNEGLPADIGQSRFELIPNGAEFIKYHYKLDSCHCDYETPVARVLWDHGSQQWELYFRDEMNLWMPYPFLAKSLDLTVLMREIEKDPQSFFWS
jgi:hypothetical protein